LDGNRYTTITTTTTTEDTQLFPAFQACKALVPMNSNASITSVMMHKFICLADSLKSCTRAPTQRLKFRTLQNEFNEYI